MKTMLKYLKEHVVMIFVIVALLLVQAFSDLALPDYTSNIVNVGIQQGGIETVVLEAVRETELDKMLALVNEDDREFLQSKYSLITDSDDSLLKKYPLAKDENVLALQDTTKEEYQRLEDILSIPAVILLNGVEGMGMPEGMMPSGDMPVSMEQLEEVFAQMPENTLTQVGTMYVGSEYKALGVDTEKKQMTYILLAGLEMLGLALLSMLCAIVVGYIASMIGSKVSRNMRKDVFSKVIGFSNNEFDKFSTASLITRTTNDVQQIQMLVMMFFKMVLFAPILGLGALWKVLVTQSSMSWVIGVAVGLVLVVMIGLFSLALPRFAKLQKFIDRLNLVTREMITGLPVIKAFSTEKYEENRFDVANIDLTKINLFVSRLMSFMMPTMMFIMNATTILVVWVGAKNIDAGTMQVGDMMALIQYAMQIVMSFLMIAMMSIVLPRAWVSVKRTSEVLDTEATIMDKENTVTPSEDVKGLVEFKNVCFRYPKASEDVLKNINFTAKKGETTAIIGSTGSGKTTLVNLIPRFFDATSGEVLVDGVNVKDMPQKELRSKLGYVPQKGVLFSGTIASNLRYGDEQASDEQIEKAARIAQATDFIKEKEKGFDDDIAQGGSNVSGGQKQRLCIARAVAIEPEVYIFDDSFSALDYKTDANLRKALKDETGESTVILIAQRISTVMNAQQIIVLDEGEVVGIGVHDTLMKDCEVYKQIAFSQLSKEELNNG